MKRQNGEQPGFTLVELVLTIVVIGILAAIALTNYIPLQKSAKRAACISNQKALEEAQEIHYSSETLERMKGTFAETIEELAPFMQDGILPSCPDGFAYELLPNGFVRCTSPDHQR
jgi:prepilin-type N-terminal cleavage/methylation domain-containing protein